VEYQARILKQLPVTISHHHGFIRDPQWRPLTVMEIEKCRVDTNDGELILFNATYDPPGCYWNRELESE
jgi:hypothetical protein